MTTLQVDTRRINALMGDYVKLSRKLPQEALAKQGTKLGYEIGSRLSQLKPGRGSIRAKRLAALKDRSGGVRVRPELERRLQEKLGLASRISDRDREKKRAFYGNGLKSSFKRKGRKLNFRALAVQAELSAREKGIGYSGVVGRVKQLNELSGATDTTKAVFSRGRYNQLLASGVIQAVPDGASLLVTFGAGGNNAGTAIAIHPEIVTESVTAVAADMGVYMARKLQGVGR